MQHFSRHVGASEGQCSILNETVEYLSETLVGMGSEQNVRLVAKHAAGIPTVLL